MSVILIVMAVLAGLGGWWLAQQRLLSKPWLEQGSTAAFPGTESGAMPAAKVGLGFLLAVVACLFALLASATFMRMELPDWQALPLPRVLWLNTGMLLLASAALQMAVTAARKGDIRDVRLALAAGGLATLVFLAGQLAAWDDLLASGYSLGANPANSFFYLLTGLHGLHIAGGLVALGRTSATAWSGAAPARLRLGVELCALYWHFLLLVWLAVFALLAGWAADIIAICRQLLT